MIICGRMKSSDGERTGSSGTAATRGSDFANQGRGALEEEEEEEEEDEAGDRSTSNRSDGGSI